MGFTAADVGSQSGRRFVVTGANAGLGFAAALVLAERGASVVLACRDAERAAGAAARIAAAVPGADVAVLRLDLADLVSVRAAAAELVAGPPIDVLVANAGVMMPPHSLTEQGFELQFGVNHLGHFALIGLVHRHVADRIVLTASVAHRGARMDTSDLAAARSYWRWPRYQMSKLANLLMMFELDRRLRAAGRATLAVGCHPGAAATELVRNLPGPLRALMPIAAPFINSAASGAWPTLQAATGPDVAGGDYYGPQGPGEFAGQSGRARATQTARDPAIAAELWTRSVDLTGVDPGL